MRSFVWKSFCGRFIYKLIVNKLVQLALFSWLCSNIEANSNNWMKICYWFRLGNERSFVMPIRLQNEMFDLLLQLQIMFWALNTTLKLVKFLLLGFGNSVAWLILSKPSLYVDQFPISVLKLSCFSDRSMLFTTTQSVFQGLTLWSFCPSSILPPAAVKLNLFNLFDGTLLMAVFVIASYVRLFQSMKCRVQNVKK